MTKEAAKERSKAIERELKKLEKISWPFQLLLLLTLLANAFSSNDAMQSFLSNGKIINVAAIILFFGIFWLRIKSWRLNKERDKILAEYGVW